MRVKGPPEVFEHPDRVHHAAFADDGSLLAMASIGNLGGSPGVVTVVNTKDLCLQTQFEESQIADLSFLRNSVKLVSAGRNHISLWDAESGAKDPALLVAKAGELLDFCTLCFSEDGSRLAVATEQRKGAGGQRLKNATYVFEMPQGKHLATLDAGGISSLTFHGKENRLLIARHEDGSIEEASLWDVAAQRMLAELTEAELQSTIGDSLGLRPCLPSGDCKRLIVAGPQIHVFEAPAGSAQWKLGRSMGSGVGEIHHSQLAPDESAVLVLGAEREDEEEPPTGFSIRRIDLAKGNEVWRAAIDGKCYSMAQSPDGSLVTTMSGEVTEFYEDDASEFRLALWDARTGKELQSIQTAARKTRSLVHIPEQMRFSRDGRFLVVGHVFHAELWAFAR